MHGIMIITRVESELAKMNRCISIICYHPELVEDEFFRPHDTAVISIPQKAPANAILRDESPFDLLERIKKVATEWVKPGHRKGSNTHNVSATVSLKQTEWDQAGKWMWENRDHYNGLSVLPYGGGTYTCLLSTSASPRD